MKKILLNPQLLRTSAMLSMTLGLAPFFPEPHVWGKIKWVMGGAVGMQPMDWFDLLLHGTPWLVLMAALATQGLEKLKTAGVK